MAIPLYIVVAVALCRMAQGRSRRRLMEASVLGAGLVSTNAASLTNYYTDSRYWRDDYRSVGALVRESRDAGMLPVLLWGFPPLLERYGSGSVTDGRDLPENRLGIVLRDGVAAAGAVLLIVNRPFYAPDTAAVMRAVGGGYRLRLTGVAPGFRLYCLTDSTVMGSP
jgi:hypothetical protein